MAAASTLLTESSTRQQPAQPVRHDIAELQRDCTAAANTSTFAVRSAYSGGGGATGKEIPSVRYSAGH